MASIRKEDTIQAVLIADTYDKRFYPFTRTGNGSLLPLVNAPMIDYALEALNRSKVDEVFVFVTNFVDDIKAHIRQRQAAKCTWAIKMAVHVVGSDGCVCLGDALRDLYAKQLLRKHFILLGADTVTNANLYDILQTHIKKCAFDEGAAMTVVYKKAAPGLVTGRAVIIAKDARNNRLLFHERVTADTKHQRYCNMPLELFVDNADIEIRHDLSDPEIAICSPAVLSLFADNFDFETRDDFVRGLLINEEILASTIYVTELANEQYAAQVADWQMYRLVSHDIVNRWTYPLVPDMGVCCLEQIYKFLRNNVYVNRTVQLAKSVVSRENVVIDERCVIADGTELANSVVGRNCTIGRNCTLENAFVFDNVHIKDGCTLKNCVIGSNYVVAEQSDIDGKFLVEAGVGGAKAAKHVVVQESVDEGDTYGCPINGDISYQYESSECSSSSSENESHRLSPIPDDANIFLTEVIDSLERGYKEKTNPDFLILEINSSRYAYNMSLSEVNFYVVKALLNLYPIKESDGSILTAFNQIFAQLNGVLKNYIRGDQAMTDCLKAIEESCYQNETLKSKIAQIIHFLYDKEIVTEESILSWHDELDDNKEWVRSSLAKLIEWLNTSSEEETSDEE